jgi:small subunit ribosomal protein S20
MPHHKAYKKTMRQDEVARQQNRAYRAQMRRLIRKVQEAPTKAVGQEQLKKAIVVLDRLARKGIIHKNNAANHKSRLGKYVSKLPA